MKLTKSKLKQLIKEELAEMNDPLGGKPVLPAHASDAQAALDAIVAAVQPMPPEVKAALANLVTALQGEGYEVNPGSGQQRR